MALFVRDIYLEETERTDPIAALDYLLMRAEKLNTDEAMARVMGECFWLLLCKDEHPIGEANEQNCRRLLSAFREIAERAPKGALLPALAGHITEGWHWFFADYDPAASLTEAMQAAERRSARLFAKALLTDPRNPLAVALAYPRNPDGRRNLPADVKRALLDSLSGESAIEFYLKNAIC